MRVISDLHPVFPAQFVADMLERQRKPRRDAGPAELATIMLIWQVPGTSNGRIVRPRPRIQLGTGPLVGPDEAQPPRAKHNANPVAPLHMSAGYLMCQ